jgi:hypothetical protein
LSEAAKELVFAPGEQAWMRGKGLRIYTRIWDVTAVNNSAVTIEVVDKAEGDAVITLDLVEAERLAAAITDRLRAMPVLSDTC